MTFKVAEGDANIPEDVLLLEPRSLYDQALVGFAHQGGIKMAVYDRQAVIEAIATDVMDDDDDEDASTSAIEHYEFNVSGSIGLGYPVFMLNEDGE